jgi:hypothetical protein
MEKPSASEADETGELAGLGCSVVLYVFGSALAMTISWSLGHSVLPAIVNGALSWLYVIYYVLTR